jgi:peptide/nickel transport system ATP-binding protein
LSVIFVTHDIGAAVEVADRMAVMYAGRIVEEGLCAELIRSPRHPYTQALLASRTHAGLNKTDRLATIAGAPPDVSNLPAGCAFASRCPQAVESCRQRTPDAVRWSSTQWSLCDRQP